ncbi:MAG: DUF2147 domain-containing protein, partial [Proteobacteria bacterium]|nr:DUF2147 domain-containing protein [Pseudomonadota bacterium]
AAQAEPASPIGVWIDDTGQGAIEIKDCGGKLCGSLVWTKSNSKPEGCKVAILGELSAEKSGSWGGGWIYDPRADARFDVEITPVGAEKLKVMGYKRVKALSRTMTWTRAPADLKRCDEPAAPGVVTAEAKPAPATSPAAGGGSPSLAEIAPQKAHAPARTRSARRTDKRKGSTVRLASLGAYGLGDVTMRKSRGACSLRISDFGRVAFPC